MPSPTIRDIAAKAKVSNCTVSRALRGDHRIGLKTREHIQEIARKMRYRSNPLVTAWMSHVRQSQRKMQASISLALLIMDEINSTPWVGNWVSSRYIDGARKRAESLGYRIEEIWGGDPELTQGRLGQILLARGFDGILLPVFFTRRRDVMFNLEPFALAAIGHRIDTPCIHFAASDQHSVTFMACKEALKLGYRRIGLTLARDIDERNEKRFSAPYLAWKTLVPNLAKIPIFYYDHHGDLMCKRMESWCRKYNPDIILGLDEFIKPVIERFSRVPEDVAFVHLDWHQGCAELAGIDQLGEDIGAAAVDIIAGQINRNERGIPQTQRATLIEGCWRNGASAPPKMQKNIC